MSASLDDHIKSGMAHGQAVLDAVEADRGVVAAHAFLAGMMQAIATWNSARRGSRSTYEMLNGLAECAIDPEVAHLAFEADLRDAMRRRMRKAGH